MPEDNTITPSNVPTMAPALGPLPSRGGGCATKAETTGPPADGATWPEPGTNTAVPLFSPGYRIVSTPDGPGTQAIPPPPMSGGMAGGMMTPVLPVVSPGTIGSIGTDGVGITIIEGPLKRTCQFYLKKHSKAAAKHTIYCFGRNT